MQEVEELSETGRLLFVPYGFADGFVVLSETVYFCYSCDNYYISSDEIVVCWNDPLFGIDWCWPIPPFQPATQRHRIPSRPIFEA